MKTDEHKIFGLKCACRSPTMKILFFRLLSGRNIGLIHGVLKDCRNRINLYKCAECPCQTRTCGGARAFYIRLHIHICSGGGCQSHRTECQIIGPLSKGIPRYAGIFSDFLQYFQLRLFSLPDILRCFQVWPRSSQVFWVSSGVCRVL